MENYSFGKTLIKGIKYFVIFAIPILINMFTVHYSQWASLTVGGLLVMFYNWLKVKWGFNLP